MSRLNKETREEIVANALAKSPVPARFAAYDKRHAAWVEKCRIESLGGKKEVERINTVLDRATKLLEGVPKSLISSYPALKTDDEIYLNIAGCAYVARFPMVSEYEREHKLCGNRSTSNRFPIEADHPLAVEFFELEQEYKTLRNIEEAILTQVRATVYSCTTVAQLLKVWPEAIELLPKYDASIVAGVPSVDVKGLNSLIGLPTE